MKFLSTLSALAVAAAILAAPAARAEDLFDRAPVFASLGGSFYDVEGDMEAKPGLGAFLSLGYSFNAWWDLEVTERSFAVDVIFGKSRRPTLIDTDFIKCITS